MYRNYAVLGACFMVINNIALVGLDTGAKILTQSMSSVQIVFLYKLFLFIAILPLIFIRGLHTLKTSELKVHFLRSLFSVLGGICFYKGLQNVKIADAAALENLQYIFLSIVGIIFFKEKLTMIKVLAIILGFIGATIIVNPQFFASLYGGSITSMSNSYFYIYLALIFWGLNSITVKLLGKTEKNRTQLFYLLLFAVLWSFPGAILRFENLELYGFKLSIIPIGLIDFSAIRLEWFQIKYLLMMSSFYFIHALAYFNALKRDFSFIVPFRYSKLMFGGIAGYLVFHETPDHLEYLGYTLIIMSGFMLIRGEANHVK